jgi:hypothetical protein
LKKTTEPLQDLTAPRKTFYSFNGCGTMLLDYRALPDGTYEAVRWVTIFCLPIVPLGAYVIEPTSQTFRHGQETSKFSIIDQTALTVARVLRTYLLVAIGFAPIVLGSLNSSAVNHALGGPLAFLAMLLAIGWGIYILFFRIRNDGKAYKRKAATA